MTYFPSAEPEAQSSGASGALRNAIAWLVIVVCTIALAWPSLPGQAAPGSEKPEAVAQSTPQLDIMLRLANGLAHPDVQDGAQGGGGVGPMFMGGDEDMERLAKSAGPGGELAGAIMLAQLRQADAADEILNGLQEQIDAGELTASPEFMQLLEDVRSGLAVSRAGADSGESLSPDAQARLKDQLGIAGDSLVVMASHDPVQMRELASQGLMLVGVLAFVGCFGLLLGLVGLGLLIAFVVQGLRGKLKGPGPSAGARAPIYAEMFAVWMLAFVGLNRLPRLFLSGGGEAGEAPVSTEVQLVLGIAGMVLALAVACAYARIRGISWSQLRADTGLAAPRFADLGWGILGYMMGIALLGVGLVVTMILLAVFAGDGTAMPSHPVQDWLQNGNAAAVALTFVVASIVAPITEEFVFRGALYRNLRDMFGLLGGFAAAAISVMITSVIFAAIHPQGLFFIPVLAALAVAFCLLREWRGSIYPGIWAHAINNTLILGLNVILLRG